MIDEINDLHPANQEAVRLLAGIATASTRVEAIQLEYYTHALMWRLEVYGTLTRLDADNLSVVFRVALEQRLKELSTQ